MQVSSVQAPARFDEQGSGGSGNAVSFEGFDPPESNFWRLPNNWFDLAARFTSWAEHKVVEYILRHTWGYHEYGIAKLITMDEFMHGRKRRDGSRLDAGCGMAENSIKKGIADAVAHGFLIVQIDDSDRGRIKKYYAPRMRRPPVDEGAHSIPIGGQPLIGQDQSLTPTPQSLILAPQSLTLQEPEPIPTAQSLIPSHPASDPRTEETLLETHPLQDTRSNNHRVVVLPAKDQTHPLQGTRSNQGRNNRHRHAPQSFSSPQAPSSVSVLSNDSTSPPAPRGRIRDRAGQAASAGRPADISDQIGGQPPSRTMQLPAQAPLRGNSPQSIAPVPPHRLAVSPPARFPSRHAAQSYEAPLGGEISANQSPSRHAEPDSSPSPVLVQDQAALLAFKAASTGTPPGRVLPDGGNGPNPPGGFGGPSNQTKSSEAALDHATYRDAANARPTDRGRRNSAIRPQSPMTPAGATPADEMQAMSNKPPMAPGHAAPADETPPPRPSPLRAVPVSQRLSASYGERTPPAYKSEAPNPLVARLVAEGIGAPKARALVATVPAERIERQLAWIDGRSYRDRAATLVASIESDFTAPPPPRRPPAAEEAGFDRGKYYRGSYALCPRCGARPCAPTCDASQPPSARRS